MAGRVLERKRGAGRPPGPRAPLPSVLHSTVGMLEANKRYYYTIRLIGGYSIDVEYQWTFSHEISKILIVLLLYTDLCIQFVPTILRIYDFMLDWVSVKVLLFIGW